MSFCPDCGVKIEGTGSFCSKCGSNTGPTPASRVTQLPAKKSTHGRLIILSIFVGVILLLLVIGSTSDHTKEASQLTGKRFVAQNTLAGIEESDVFDAVKASKNNDTAGLLALIGSGRIYEVSAGTEVESYGISAFGLALVRFESGSLIGKKLYMDPSKLNRSAH